MINPSQVVPDKPEVQDTAAEPVTTTRPTCNPPPYPWLRDGLSFVSVCQGQIKLSSSSDVAFSTPAGYSDLLWFENC